MCVVIVVVSLHSPHCLTPALSSDVPVVLRSYTNWWATLLYVSNLTPYKHTMDRMCVAWTWYLQVRVAATFVGKDV